MRGPTLDVGAFGSGVEEVRVKPISAIEVISSLADEASGTGAFVLRLREALLQVGESVTVAALDAGRAAGTESVLEFSRGFGPRRLGRSPAMHRWLTNATRDTPPDVIHSHNLWMMPNVYPAWAVRRSCCKLIVSPHGALAARALAESAIKKKVFWWLMQHRALKDAACFHATAVSECEDIRRFGFRQPIALIPPGTDIPDIVPSSPTDRRRLLYLGRLHPIKGLDLLLNAWAALYRMFPEWDLEVVGPDNDYPGYRVQLEGLATKLQLQRIAFRGPVYGDEKARAYQQAELFVLPSYSENFGLTVAESLAAATPVVVSKGAPWEGIESHHAGWWVNADLPSLISVLENSLSQSRNDLAVMGMAGRAWMQDEFSWSRVAQMMDRTYSWLARNDPRPPWIQTVEL